MKSSNTTALLILVVLHTSIAFGQPVFVGGKLQGSTPPQLASSVSCSPIFSFDTPDLNENGIDAEGNYIWTGGGEGTGIYKVDGTTGIAVQVVPMPYTFNNMYVGDLDFHDGYLYHVYEQTGFMHKIDPVTGNVVDSLLLPNNSTNPGDPNNWGIACEVLYFWNMEYAVIDVLQKFSYLHKISYSGTVIDSFLIPHWILPIKIINGGLWGASFDTPYIYQFDTTNGAIIDSIYQCVSMCYGLTQNSMGYWLVGGVPGSTDRVHLFGSWTGAADISENKMEPKLFPNPTSGTLYMDFAQTNSEWINVELFSLDGSRVLFRKFESAHGSLTLDLTGLKSGIYQVRTTDQQSIWNGRIVIYN